MSLRRRLRRAGQTTAEYVLVISVIVIAIITVVYGPLGDAFDNGSKGFRDNMKASANAGSVGIPSGGTINTDPR